MITPTTIMAVVKPHYLTLDEDEWDQIPLNIPIKVFRDPIPDAVNE